MMAAIELLHFRGPGMNWLHLLWDGLLLCICNVSVTNTGTLTSQNICFAIVHAAQSHSYSLFVKYTAHYRHLYCSHCDKAAGKTSESSFTEFDLFLKHLSRLKSDTFHLTHTHTFRHQTVLYFSITYFHAAL